MSNTGGSGVALEYGQATDPGLDPAKRVNEDACGYVHTEYGHLFVVCDGMGGHAGGKQASDIAIRTIFERMAERTPNVSCGDALVAAIEEAGRQVYAFGGPPTNPQRPGSTCVAVVLSGDRLDVAHVGDSRAYAIRGKQIYRLTRDHSMVQELLDGGVISEQEAIGHPDSNKITRALGMTPEVEVEKRSEPMELYEGDVFVLASDGLTDLARNDDILVTVTEYLKAHDIQAVCDELVALANRRGGHDNITVQVGRVLKTDRGASMTQVQGPPGNVEAAPSWTGTLDMPPPAGGVTVAPTTVRAPPVDRGSSPEASPSARERSGGTTTVVQGPALADDAMPVAASEVIIEPVPETLVDPRPFAPGGRTFAALPEPRGERQNVLVYALLAMAALVGLLIALLIWALFFR
ncbi:MAG: protein phosphatase 2C domain-containing protein [Myxococcota bacterium]